MSGRVYVVTVAYTDPLHGESATENHLVRSISPKSAQRCVASKFISAKLAGVADVTDLMSKGKKILDGMPKSKTSEAEPTSLETGDE